MRRKLGSKKRSSEEMSIQITSMADIFIIILVFLLKSISTSSIQINPSAGMKMPEVSGLTPPVEALKVEISETSIQIEEKPVAQLEKFRFAPSDLQNNLIPSSVSKALDTEKKRQQLIAKANSDVKVDTKILIVADQRTPYSTLKSVLAAAAQNGFTDYKLVAVNKE